MVAIILAEPEHPGNIGSVCRAMANFGFSELILINPACNHLAPEGRNLAKNAQALLEGARVADWSVLDEFGVIAATAGVPATDYNLRRSPLTPAQGAAKLASVKATKTSHRGAALLFGRESSGLRNEELERADFVITIQTKKRYPSMNLSHAVAIMLYELRVAGAAGAVDAFTPIPAHEKKILLAQFDAVIDILPFPTASMRRTQRRLWRLLLGRAMLTRREMFALFGFLRATEQSRGRRSTLATQQQGSETAPKAKR